MHRHSDEILRPIVVTFSCLRHLMFQHDNAQPHVARICIHFLEAEGPFLPWPAYSDMTPIEHVWDALDWWVQQRVPVPLISNNFTQPLKRSGTTLHNQQPDQSYAKEMCHAAWGKLWSHQILTGFLIHIPYLEISVTNICLSVFPVMWYPYIRASFIWIDWFSHEL